MGAWTRDTIEAEGLTTNVAVLAEVLNVNKDTVYTAIRRDEWTLTRVLRIGRCIKIPTRDIVALLCPPEDAAELAPRANPAVPSQCQHGDYSQVTPSKSQSQCGCRGRDCGASVTESSAWGRAG